MEKSTIKLLFRRSDMAEVTTKTKFGEKIKKGVDYVNANTMTMVGIIISFFVPVLGSVLALIGLKRMDKAKKEEEKADAELYDKCEQAISAAKNAAKEIVENKDEK